MTLNLVLAICWLGLAVGSIVFSLLQPDAKAIAGNVSPTWVAGVSLLMFAYNLLRWWFMRLRRRERQTAKRASDRIDRKDQEYNPDFDFSDEPEKTDGN
jgi:hypothetical protein